MLKDKKTDYYFRRSFFPEGKRYYTKNQASWTLLFKRKQDCLQGRKPFYMTD